MGDIRRHDDALLYPACRNEQFPCDHYGKAAGTSGVYTGAYIDAHDICNDFYLPLQAAAALPEAAGRTGFAGTEEYAGGAAFQPAADTEDEA